MFNNLKETIDLIEFYESKIEKLIILQGCKKFTNIQIHFFADNKHFTMYQNDCPFSLETEIKNLAEDSINELQTTIHNLKQQL